MDGEQRELRAHSGSQQRPPIRGWRPRGKAALLAAATVGALVALAGCAEEGTSVLDPRGPRADVIEDLWSLLFTLGVAVFAVVTLLLLVGLAVAWRRQVRERELPTGNGVPFIVVGTAVSAAIMVVVFGFTLWAMAALADPDEAAAATIEVVGNRWWWDVRYPEEGVVTANEIHVPVGEPVRIELTSDDVIHSFWVPQLAGKLDLIPGRVNTFWIEADEPGIYRGQCAEYCGIQHAHMSFLVVAQPREEYDAWLEAQRQPAAEPIVEEGKNLFMTVGCAACHTIRGTEADGEVGPDLTHLASRRTLAAGTLEFNYGNLTGWVADPQGIKPGALMPNLQLTAEELFAIVSYLLSLK